MDEIAFNLVRTSVIEHSMSDDERQLEGLRITRDKVLPPMNFLFRIFGKPCFPRGELVAITGKAKSGKTLFNSLLMACCVNLEALQVHRNADVDPQPPDIAPLKVLWYDTEQSEQSTQDILKNRILRMVREAQGALCSKTSKIDTESDEGLIDFDGCLDEADTLEHQFDVFNVRSLHYEERMRLFKTAVRKYRPALVVLDGVRDLLADINDGVRAQEVVEELMKLAQETDCCLVCVLHQNKGAEDRNPRGWIGTELMNKAFEVYSCEKVKPENIFMVEQTHTRKYDLGQLMFFRMDPDTELPVVCEAPVRMGVTSAVAAEQQGDRLPPMNRMYLEFDDNNRPRPKMDELFYEVLKAGPLYYNELQNRVQGLLNCSTKMWNYMFTTMRDRGAIVRLVNREGRAIWQLPSAVPAQPSQRDLFELPADFVGVHPTP